MSQQKIWFVTGSSTGFGRIWTEAALRRGDKVVATARDPRKLEDLRDSFGESVLVLPLDVTDREAVFQTVGEGHRHFGRLDVVVSNAGYGYMGAVEEVEFAEFKSNFETNVFGALSVMQAALPLLRKQRSGRILAVSSIGGLVSSPTGGSYGPTKFALEAMTEALAGEVAEFGIRVTIIEPGSFATDFGSSKRSATPMAEYGAVRDATNAKFQPENAGDPRATAAAILKLVDSDDPPLRLLLGSTPLPIIRESYAKRIETWEAWTQVSDAAQGSGGRT